MQNREEKGEQDEIEITDRQIRQDRTRYEGHGKRNEKLQRKNNRCSWKARKYV